MKGSRKERSILAVLAKERDFWKPGEVCVWCVSPIRRQGLFYTVRGASGTGMNGHCQLPTFRDRGRMGEVLHRIHRHHENVFIGNKIPCQAVLGAAGVAVSHPATACLLLPGVTDSTWLLLNVSTKLLILLGIHILVHTEMSSQLLCKIFRKLDKSLLSTFITNHGVEMALSSTAASPWGRQCLPGSLQGFPCLLGVCWELCWLTGTLFQGQ